MEKGKFISFEGIDCCGKTTQIKKLTAYLNSRNVDYFPIKEPGTTTLGNVIRALSKYPEESHYALNSYFLYMKPGEFEGMNMHATRTPEAEIFLFLSARADLKNIIKNKLETGISIIADRFADSTRAYQGGGRFNGNVKVINLIDRMNDFAIDGIWPDKTLFLDIGYDEMMRRKKENKPDYMESLGREFFERTIEEYHVIARSNPNRIIVIDGMKDKETVFNEYILPEVKKIWENI